MTEGLWLGVIAGLPTTLAVILSAIVQMRQFKDSNTRIAVKVEEVAAHTYTTAATAEKLSKAVVTKLDEVASQTAVTAIKTDEVHVMVNSRLSEALAEIERQRKVVEELRELMRASGGIPPPINPSKIADRPPNP